MLCRIKNPIVIHYNSEILIAAIRALMLALNDNACWIRVKQLLPAPTVKLLWVVLFRGRQSKLKHTHALESLALHFQELTYRIFDCAYHVLTIKFGPRILRLYANFQICRLADLIDRDVRHGHS